MLTKIATDTPEFYLFTSRDEEMAYWDEICPLCHTRACNDDCVFVVSNAVECDDCRGLGRIKFIVRRGYPDAYSVITKCGICDGVGLV